MRLRHPEVIEWIERYECSTALLPCAAYEPRGTVPLTGWSAPLG
jgi:hypothetical protein